MQFLESGRALWRCRDMSNKKKTDFPHAASVTQQFTSASSLLSLSRLESGGSCPHSSRFSLPSRAPVQLGGFGCSQPHIFLGGSFTERTSTYPSLASHFPWEPQHQAAAAGSRAANIVVTDVLGRHTCTWWISTWPSVSRRGINNTANSILHVYYRPACGGRGGFMCRVWYINPD